MQPLTRNVTLASSDTPQDNTPESRLFTKTLHFSFDVVVPHLLNKAVMSMSQDVADAMAVAATSVLYNIATDMEKQLKNNNTGGPSVN